MAQLRQARIRFGRQIRRGIRVLFYCRVLFHLLLPWKIYHASRPEKNVKCEIPVYNAAGFLGHYHGMFSMKHIFRFPLLLSVLLLASSPVLAVEIAPAPADTLALLEKVCDWQIAYLPAEKTSKNDTDLNWLRATFYTGDMALYRASHQPRYLDEMMKIAEENHWMLGHAANGSDSFADILAVSQLYTELYFIKKDPQMLADTRKRFDQIIANPKRGREDWWWCDALFMAPPAFARLTAVTGDEKYLDFMDKQWWDTVEFLYDPEHHLFYRDKNFLTKKESNGQPVFWSRGNGWVLAGTARVLQYMPKDFPSRPRYVHLFQQMSEKIASLQQPDGFWRASLLDPTSFPNPETSGTALFCYGLAWGINAGILPRGQYLPIVTSAWKALASAVDPATGKLGWVQTVGFKPAGVKADDTAEFGVGAFLLAGTEMLKLNHTP